MEPESREERALTLLVEAHNRAILDVLEATARSLHVDELAERLVSRDDPLLRSSEFEVERDRLRVSLHHNHLPKLAEAGLVEYDRDENVVAEGEASAIDAEWQDLTEIDDVLARFRAATEPDENAIGVIEGRENVIERGRQLADEAEEELFLLYVSDDLLEDDCLGHARDAIRRGVDIYLGSQNPTVRDLVRRRLPEVTIWEPQFDWMNLPLQYPKVGRLVLADREKIMLALLDEPDSDGTYVETAMTGEGRANPLVVLVRELLGPRLDHLDYQSERFRGELPF